jgi:hypothetical protein
LLQKSFENATKGDLITNVEMKLACYDCIDVVEQILVQLSHWFPPTHFGGVSGADYFSQFVSARYQYRSALQEPEGEATAGREAATHAALAVLTDMCSAVPDIVRCLFGQDELDYKEWHRRWTASWNSFRL